MGIFPIGWSWWFIALLLAPVWVPLTLYVICLWVDLADRMFRE
jgi:hypothetical protein